MNGLRAAVTSTIVGAVFMFAALPGTTNYQIQDYGFGNGGGSTGTATYKLEGIAGEVSDDTFTGTYITGAGMQPTQQAEVPPAPTLSNPNRWYNKMHVVINPGTNPSDTTFAVAISTDNFTTTNYVQNDATVGGALGAEDYQTYTTWGGASGFDVIGLDRDTMYYFKVKAHQGQFTESGYSTVANLRTSDVELTFDIDVSATDSPTNSPYQVGFGNLLVNSVNSSPVKVWFSLDTNALSGGKVYIISQYAGLRSSLSSYTIGSLSGDLSAVQEGFGAQGTSVAQTSGGPFALVNPYDGVSDIVGTVDNTYRAIFTTANSITGGRSSFVLKAKTKGTTPASSDYSTTLTAVAAPAF